MCFIYFQPFEVRAGDAQEEGRDEGDGRGSASRGGAPRRGHILPVDGRSKQGLRQVQGRAGQDHKQGRVLQGIGMEHIFCSCWSYWLFLFKFRFSFASRGSARLAASTTPRERIGSALCATKCCKSTTLFATNLSTCIVCTVRNVRDELRKRCGKR